MYQACIRREFMNFLQQRTIQCFSLSLVMIASWGSTTLCAQNSVGAFSDPPFKKVSTLGELLTPLKTQEGSASVTADGFEAIVGEPVSPPVPPATLSPRIQQRPATPTAPALQSIPADAQYGPVGGFSEPETGQPVPGSQQKTVTPSLPNKYRGDVFFPEGTFSDPPQSSSRRQGPARIQRKPASAGDPGIARDKLIAIEKSASKLSGREIIRERYDDGSVRILRSIAQDTEGNYFNDGGFILYDRSQTPIAAGSYSQGKLEGEWERIYKVGAGGLFTQAPYNLFTGPFKSTATFRQGKLEGSWRLTDREGRPMATVNYVSGVREGPAVWYFPEGNKMQQARYKQGLPEGFVQRWSREGKLSSREQFVDGRKVIRQQSKFADQGVATESTFLGRRLKSSGRDDWWAAKPAVLEEVGEQIQHGPVREWYPNRQPKLSGQFVKGEREGRFTWWHQNGNKKAEGQFSQGSRTAIWRYWHSSGMKRSEGQFEDNQPIGVWRSWDVNGKLVTEKDVEKPVEPEEPIELSPPSVIESMEAESADTGDGDESIIDTESLNVGQESDTSLPGQQERELLIEDEPKPKSGGDTSEEDFSPIELESIDGETVGGDPGSIGGS